eukprot:2756786-Rhodomonas_salina.3
MHTARCSPDQVRSEAGSEARLTRSSDALAAAGLQKRESERARERTCSRREQRQNWLMLRKERERE